MKKLISGIHHITAIASDPQKNIDFYTRVLALRLVKKTINFDAPDVYHFYFGDEVGAPGTILTFFPFKGAGRGRKGAGEVTFTSFAVDESSLSFWRERLSGLGIILSDRFERFGLPVIRFQDHDGLGIELVGVTGDERKGWTSGNVPDEHAVKGFFGATLNLRSRELTADLLTEVLNYQYIGEEDNRFRYGINGNPGEVIDIVINDPSERSVQSAGSVHHLAFRTLNEGTQLEVQQNLIEYGQQVTEVKDRNYFQSIYFREPGGILFEVATDEPGFLIDENIKFLGEELKLPEWAAAKRDQISQRLQQVNVNYNLPWNK